jgi:lysophospholipase L1-like esterase
MTTTPPSPRSRLLPVLLGAAVVAGVGLGAAVLTGRPDGDVRAEETGRPVDPAPTAEAAPPAGTPSPSHPVPSADDPAGAPRIAFLGDSLTVGVGAPPERGYAWQTAERLDWPIALVEGVSGSGFLAPGGGEPMPARVPAIVAAHPDVVVVAGGNNDAFQGYPADAVERAATGLLTDLREGLPDARLVVVGPFPISLEEAAAPGPTHRAVRAAAEAAGADFVDAGSIVESAVRTDDDWSRYISADGLHPNELGYSVMADALAAELRSLVG